jgi:hypothetical protein
MVWEGAVGAAGPGGACAWVRSRCADPEAWASIIAAAPDPRALDAGGAVEPAGRWPPTVALLGNLLSLMPPLAGCGRGLVAATLRVLGDLVERLPSEAFTMPVPVRPAQGLGEG